MPIKNGKCKIKNYRGMNARVIIRLWEQLGLPGAVAEYRFHPEIKWRFDFAFPNTDSLNTDHRLLALGGVAVEVQGGIWTRGRHTRGKALKQEWDKLNAAAGLGWRVLYCAPGAELTDKFVKQLRAALDFNRG
jgi:hypothetical protein